MLSYKCNQKHLLWLQQLVGRRKNHQVFDLRHNPYCFTELMVMVTGDKGQTCFRGGKFKFIENIRPPERFMYNLGPNLRTIIMQNIFRSYQKVNMTATLTRQ